jgi:hypothetical protein
MLRRAFLKTLAGFPAIAAVIPKKFMPQTDYELPVGCDLSMTSLQVAINFGNERDLGKARKLLIGPENLFVARELLGVLGIPYSTDPVIMALRDEMLVYEVTREYPMNTWVLQFEHGTVKSVGP